MQQTAINKTALSAQLLFNMEQRRVLITGGGTGLGRGFAELFVAQGAQVMLAARREQVLADTAAQLNDQAGAERVSYVLMDVSDSGHINAALDSIQDWGPIDVLINNAGIVNAQPMLKLTETEWDKIQNVNLKAAWQLSKQVVQRFIDQRSSPEADASIVNIASILALSHLSGSSTYGASKAALLHLTRSMAMEWSKYNVRANAISPGYINTDMAHDFLAGELGQKMLPQVPLRRYGEVQDVCAAALLLASPASAYMTGTNIVVDGGHSLAKIL